jgi:hypothetical protein
MLDVRLDRSVLQFKSAAMDGRFWTTTPRDATPGSTRLVLRSRTNA